MPPSLLKFWQLDGDLEPLFQQSHDLSVVVTFNSWCLLLVLGCLAFLVQVLVGYLQGAGAWHSVVVLGVLAAYFAVLLLLLNCTPIGRRGACLLLHLSCLLVIGCSTGYVHLTLDDHATLSLRELSAYNALQANTTAQAGLQAYITDVTFQKLCLASLLAQYLLLDGLRLMGCTGLGLALHFLPPIAYSILWTMCNLSSDLLVGICFTSLYMFCSNVHMNCMLRSEFWLRQQLQQSLSHEAQALQRAREAEVAHKEAALKADSMLHHILKNIMADARGCIDMYLEGMQRHVAHLERGRACLERGMQWCMKRLVLMQIASGSYEPNHSPTDLKEFGETLISGRQRQVKAELVHLLVTLDPLLCSVVLDNAISNALRHGHPDDPRVTFSIACHLLSEKEEDGKQRLLVFRVTNRADPDRPTITPDFLQDRLTGEEPADHVAVSPLPNGLGLQHLWLAAAAHNMHLSLRQVDETVIFEASLAVTICDQMSKNGILTSPHPALALSTGLHVCCLDDSEMARRLMLHCLQVHLHEAKPRVFGATIDEVQEFISASLLEADIVILDQHLEYGSVTMLGTDVVSQLLERGFTGFIVMRSANSDERHQLHYQQCGAHLTVGKDVPGRELVAQVHVAYRQFLRTQVCTALLPGARLQVPTCRRLEPTVRSVSRLLEMESCPCASPGSSMRCPLSEVPEMEKGGPTDWDAVAVTPGMVRGLEDFPHPPHRQPSLRSATFLSEGLFDTFTPQH
eukprot:GGOE01008717.1.p1 GENE.GGOE01008717.1~~GGOE01008717.1.p1  ORF type:complete len:759 (+),score=248.32 GGOE01008717.1:52-2277(+)